MKNKTSKGKMILALLMLTMVLMANVSISKKPNLISTDSYFPRYEYNY
jgi:hypothetical protein